MKKQKKTVRSNRQSRNVKDLPARSAHKVKGGGALHKKDNDTRGGTIGNF